jgi:hypothetical protein
MRRVLLSRAAAVAFAGALLMTGSTPALSADEPVVQIHACVIRLTGSMRIVQPAQACRSYESRLVWNETGPRGPVGPAGPAGPQGPQGPQGPPGPGSTTDHDQGSFAVFVDGGFVGFALRLEGCKVQRELIEVRESGPDGQLITRLVPGKHQLLPCVLDLPMPASDSPLWRWLTSTNRHEFVVERYDPATRAVADARAVDGAVVASLRVPSDGLLRLTVRGNGISPVAAIAPTAAPGTPVDRAEVVLGGASVSDRPGELVLDREIIEVRESGPDGRERIVLVPGRYVMKTAQPRTTAGTPAVAGLASWMAGTQTRAVTWVATAGDRTLRVGLDGCLWERELDAHPRTDGRLGWSFRCPTTGLAVTPG